MSDHSQYFAASPATIVTGLAENVPECGKRVWGASGFITSITSALPATAPTGKPPPMTLPRAIRSARTS